MRKSPPDDCKHEVKDGEWVVSICEAYGHNDWEKVWNLPENDELKRRQDGWKAPATKYTSDALAKYARLVSSASEGAV